MAVYISRALMYLEVNELWIHFVNVVGVHSSFLHDMLGSDGWELHEMKALT